MPRTPSTPSPSRRARLGLVAASAALALAVGELAVALFAPRVRVYSELLTGEPYPAAPSDYLPLTTPRGVTFRHRVEGREIAYRFNRLGFRGPYPRDGDGGDDGGGRRRRLLILGDSFVLGWGNPLEDTFVDRVRRQLEPGGWEVINGGYRGGYSPDAYYAYLRREGLALAPAAVVVVLYPANDLADVRHNLWRRRDELGAPLDLGTMRLYMGHDGRTIHSAERLRQILPWGYRVPLARQSHLFAAAAQAADRALGRNRLSPAEAESRLELVLGATARRLGEASVDLLYVVVPADPRRATAADRAAEERLAGWLRAAVPAIDLAPRLDGAAYFERDAHLNARGNRIAAEGLLEGLAAAGILAPPDRGQSGGGG